MLSLVNILILFFSFLILYQLFLETKIIEGYEDEFKEYDTNDPNNSLILSQQNAGNINYLKERLDSLDGINQQVQDLSGNVSSLQTTVDGILQAQKDYADQMTGGTAPEITGAVEEEEEDPNTTDTTTTNLVIEEV